MRSSNVRVKKESVWLNNGFSEIRLGIHKITLGREMLNVYLVIGFIGLSTLLLRAAGAETPAKIPTVEQHVVKAGDVIIDPLLFKSPHKLSEKVIVCARCHGTLAEGDVKFDTPGLRGLSASYIANQLKSYRSKQRRHPEMEVIAGLLSDADIVELSKYYADNFKIPVNYRKESGQWACP